MPEPLSSTQKRWIAEGIRARCRAQSDHPTWGERLRLEVDNLLWAYSVDGVVAEQIKRDGWIASGQGLREAHFKRAPFTEKAWQHFRHGELKQIKREHIVPRAHLATIVAVIQKLEDLERVLEAYARVALVADCEARRIKPSKTMPREWAKGVSWASPPDTLPDAWRRYRNADGGPICPQFFDGSPAWE